MQNVKLKIVVLSFSFLIFNFLGCATVPSAPTLPTYSLNGTTYLPLISLCEQKGIAWEYDTFTRQVNLSKDNHRISLVAGDALVLVDGQARQLNYPLDFYEGALVVPYQFKGQIIDSLFRGAAGPRPVIISAYIKKVVIDAGHGGRDPGAIGRSGVREKDVNLDIARRLANILRLEGINVVMTRSADSTVSLPSRVEIANNSGADIFLSIHSNANRVRSLNGFEVYYIGVNADDSKRALSAARDGAPNLDSRCFASNSPNLRAILWDMVFTFDRAESIELAHSICRVVSRDLGTDILGVKGARFYVLKGAQMPAVLIETGFLSNPKEEKMLKNNFYRQKVAESIAEGLNTYARDIARAQTQ